MADPGWQRTAAEKTRAMLVDGTQMPQIPQSNRARRAQPQQRRGGPDYAAGFGVGAAMPPTTRQPPRPPGTRPGRKDEAGSTSRYCISAAADMDPRHHSCTHSNNLENCSRANHSCATASKPWPVTTDWHTGTQCVAKHVQSVVYCCNMVTIWLQQVGCMAVTCLGS